MSKRFIDTELFHKSWFQELGMPEKLAFILMTLLCDPSGVWSVNRKEVEFLAGGAVDWQKLVKGCNGNLVPVPGDVSKVLLVDFVGFQYGKLNQKSPVHQRIVELLDKRGLFQQGLVKALPGDWKGVGKPLSRVQEEEEEEEEEEEILDLSQEKRTREILGEAQESSSSSPPSAGVPKVDYDFAGQVWRNISDEQVATWANAFPACDVERELAKAAAWLDANPKKRKSPGVGYKRFIYGWLQREQNRGGTR